MKLADQVCVTSRDNWRVLHTHFRNCGKPRHHGFFDTSKKGKMQETLSPCKLCSLGKAKRGRLDNR